MSRNKTKPCGNWCQIELSSIPPGLHRNPLHLALSLLAVITLLLTSCNHAGAQPTPHFPAAAGWHNDQALQVDTTTRWYRYYVPTNLKPQAPAVLLFHGGTQSMRKIFEPNAGGSQAWLTLAEQEGFLLIVPNGTNPDDGNTHGDKQNWNDCRLLDDAPLVSQADDVAFATALIDWARESFNINTKRVYATGASNGGMIAQRLAIETPQQFAAIATFIATLPQQINCAEQNTPVPTMIMNATNDRFCKWEGGRIARRTGINRSTEETVHYFKLMNQTTPTAAQTGTLPDLDPKDGTTISYQRFLPLNSTGAEVLFYTIHNGGHCMPSRTHKLAPLARMLMGKQNHDAEGAELAWDFLQHHSR
ncbi:MAG: alpha/beta hydrolase family esterase [Sumerlaeia bacterium]